MNSESDVLRIICEDEWMMDILSVVNTLNLPDWWICAGFVRSKIWDTLHDFKERTPLLDIDVIYFDLLNMDEIIEKDLEEKLRNINNKIPWSVKNQARMHIINDLPQYESSVDAIAKFPDTATALGIKLNERNQLILSAPHGIDDAINLRIKPTPHFVTNKQLVSIFEERALRKNWKSIWNKIEVSYMKEF